MSAARRASAIAAIDAANAADPNRIVIDGIEQPKELAHAQLMTEWVRALDPAADDAQLIAARAHHLRRWEVPRASYPEGRAGYLRWRKNQRRRHSDLVADILTGIGYDPAFIASVGRIIRKEGLKPERQSSDEHGRDEHGGEAGGHSAVQTHEDALCLVFLQTQLDALTEQLGDDATVEVVRKSVAKMSARAVTVAGGLGMSERGRAVLERATSDAG